MLTRLTLDNFMAHGRTVIDLGPGLTVLVGPNNTGKSAVVEALRCLATNPAPRHVIRHGAKEARVTAEFADGTRVAWIRREKSAGYELLRPGDAEPVEFWKLGKQGAVPDEVQEALRLGPVTLEGGEKVDVHLGDQKKPIFLLDNQKLLAPFFAAQAESAHLLAMQKALANRVREAKAGQARAEARMAALGRELEMLEPLPGLAMAAEGLRAEHARLLAGREALPRLESMLRTLAQAAAEARRLRGRTAAAKALRQPPELHPAEGLARLADGLSRKAVERGIRARRQTVLERLSPPPALFPAPELSETLERRRALALARRMALARQAALAILAPPPALFDADRLGELLSARLRLAGRRAALQSRADRLAELRPPPHPPAVEPLADIVWRLAELCARRATLHARLDEQGAALTAFEAGLGARLEAVGLCPTCRSPLDALTFLEREEHGHEP